MHVDLWAPGTSISKNSIGRHQLKNMCDLTQFFGSNITTDTHMEHLAKLFMENGVLLFSVFAIIVVDVNSQFNSTLNDMCASLGIIYWPLAHGNHKVISFGNYHLFLNKT